MQPTIEIIPNPTGINNFSTPPQFEKGKNRRVLIFLGLFSACLASSLTYVWLRPPIYQSTASLLTVTPEESGQAGGKTSVHQVRTKGQGMLPSITLTELNRSDNTASTEHVAMQRRILLDVPLFEETLRRLYDLAESRPAGLPRLSLDDLPRLLSVNVITETNLVELQARGPEPKILAPLVNAWIDAYQGLREQTTRDAANNNYAALEEESRQLEKKIGEKRETLERFRSTYDIQSQTDSENSPMLRLKGLNEAMNKAIDEEVKAKAKLEAIRAAIARNEPLMPPEEAAGLANLEKRAQELREMQKDLLSLYTPAFLAMHPQHKQIPEKLAQVEGSIREKAENGSRALLSQAEQANASAQQAVAELRQKIVELKGESSEFTNHFAEQESMRADLERLEEMHRDTLARLAQIESRPQQYYPPLQVVGRAHPPTQPVFPYYWRDSGIALAGSLAFALAFIWLYDFLTRADKPSTPNPMPSFQFFQIPGYLPTQYRMEESELLSQQPTPLTLESPFPRELTTPEISTLLRAADVKSRQWIGLLLSGLTVKEVAKLRLEDLDLDANRILVDGERPRAVPLAPSLKIGLTQILPAMERDAEEVAARIVCAAVDSGLPQPETINETAIRHTYIAYLVRQGIRLSELEQVVGPLPARNLARYSRLSPACPGLPADQAPLIYPALRND